MAEDGEGELPSVDHGPLNKGPWEKSVLEWVPDMEFCTSVQTFVSDCGSIYTILQN